MHKSIVEKQLKKYMAYSVKNDEFTLDADKMGELVAELVKLFAIPDVSVPKGTVCEHPLKFVVYCPPEGLYWCNKCEQYISQTAR